MVDGEAVGFENAPGVGLTEAGGGVGEEAGLELLDGLKFLFAVGSREMAEGIQSRLEFRNETRNIEVLQRARNLHESEHTEKDNVDILQNWK